jgi:hypothetical protein
MLYYDGFVRVFHAQKNNFMILFCAVNSHIYVPKLARRFPEISTRKNVKRDFINGTIIQAATIH